MGIAELSTRVCCDTVKDAKDDLLGLAVGLGKAEG